MKRINLLAALAAIALLAGCATTAPSAALAPVPAPVASAAAKDSPITMANLDDFLGRPGVVVVDLRNFEDRFNGGYILGTEALPFFQFLDGRIATRGKVDGKDSWDVSLAKVNDGFAFANYFPAGNTYVLFCASGTRAAFVKTILDAKGYSTFNAGGFKDYKGPKKVLGDGVYALPAPAAH